MTSRSPFRIAAFAAFVAVLVLVLVPSALAKGKPGGTSSSSSSLGLVLLTSTDGLAHQGQEVTFTVSTTATTRPSVKLDCYQAGSWVYTASVGFYPDYPWRKQFTLSSGWWTSGEADCTATMYYTNAQGTKTTNLTSLSFHVYA